jgi:hypothetical protein
MPKFVLVHVLPTDYASETDRNKLQTVADELNRAAIEQSEQDRWIVVGAEFTEGLFKTAVSN